jgi:putative ABC transport system permease protein
MKVMEVKQQVRLPFSRCVELVFSGVQFRLFRAGITVVIIALAGAFLMTMLGESLIARRVSQALAEQTAPRELFRFWNSRLSVPLTEGVLVQELSGVSQGDPRWQEFKAWGRLSDAQLAQLIDVARRQVVYLNFFGRLSEGQLRPLVGRAEGTGIFEALRDPQRLADFKEEIGNLSGQRFPTEVADFEKFLADWSGSQPLLKDIMQGHAEVVARVRQEILQGANPTGLLARADESLRQRLLALGYQMRSEDLPVVREQARLGIDADQMQRLLSQPVERLEHPVEALSQNEDVPAEGKANPLLKNLIAQELDIGPASVSASHLFAFVSQPKGAERFVYYTRCDERFDLSQRRVQEVARNKLDQTKLSSVEAGVSQAAGRGGFMGFSNRTISLLVVSFVVCIVGIANALLMSVTERFREIATMKCLGATDGFIMLNFILESMMQGVVGGVVGVLLGFLLGTLRGWASYGWMALSNFPTLELMGAAGAALVMSVVISALAAVYPAWVAARLAPMEAMRIE